MPFKRRFPTSYTALGLVLLTLHVLVLFLPFAVTGPAASRLGLAFLASSFKDLAAAWADMRDVFAHRTTLAETFPAPLPNLAGLAGVIAILICGLLICEQTPPRWLGGLALLALCHALAPVHPYSEAPEHWLLGGVVWLGVCAVTGLSCFAAPRPKLRRRRGGVRIILTADPEAGPPVLWTRSPRMFVRR